MFLTTLPPMQKWTLFLELCIAMTITYNSQLLYNLVQEMSCWQQFEVKMINHDFILLLQNSIMMGKIECWIVKLVAYNKQYMKK